MNIAVFGTGYVGLVTAVCLASHQHNLTCVDIDAKKIEKLSLGVPPIFELGLEELLLQNSKAGRMHFTTDPKKAITSAEVIFIAVGTPEDTDGSANLNSLYAVVNELFKHDLTDKIVIVKSTVPAGTTDNVKRLLVDKKCHVVFNPEFLRQGNAIYDFLNPDRIILGTDSADAATVLVDMYRTFAIDEKNILVMDACSAEMTKYVANALLATKISFMNEMSHLASRLGADIEKVRQGIALDPRIGPHFINPGMGYGGSCFPKDISALRFIANKMNYDARILKSVEDVNEDQKLVLIDKINDFYKNDFKGKTFAVWGLAFKPNTDDLRSAPSVPFIKKLVALGAKVQAFDPVAMPNFKRDYANIENCRLVADMDLALQGADALCIVTEWGQFKCANLNAIASKLNDKVIFDGRNIFDKRLCAKAGLTYYRV